MPRSPSQIEAVWLTALSTAASAPARARYSRITLSVRNIREGLQLLWNGEPVHMACFQGSREYSVLPPDGARAKAGTVSLTLRTPGESGGLSKPFLLPVVDAPVVHTLGPQTLDATADTAVVYLGGEGFGPGSEVLWDGEPLTGSVTFLDESLSVSLPGRERRTPGTHSLQVRNGPGGALSAPVHVEVVDAAPAPVVSGMKPAVVTAGYGRVELQVFGHGFQQDSIIVMDGRARISRFAGSWTARASTPAAWCTGQERPG